MNEKILMSLTTPTVRLVEFVKTDRGLKLKFFKVKLNGDRILVDEFIIPARWLN